MRLHIKNLILVVLVCSSLLNYSQNVEKVIRSNVKMNRGQFKNGESYKLNGNKITIYDINGKKKVKYKNLERRFGSRLYERLDGLYYFSYQRNKDNWDFSLVEVDDSFNEIGNQKLYSTLDLSGKEGKDLNIKQLWDSPASGRTGSFYDNKYLLKLRSIIKPDLKKDSIPFTYYHDFRYKYYKETTEKPYVLLLDSFNNILINQKFDVGVRRVEIKKSWTHLLSNGEVIYSFVTYDLSKEKANSIYVCKLKQKGGIEKKKFSLEKFSMHNIGLTFIGDEICFTGIATKFGSKLKREAIFRVRVNMLDLKVTEKAVSILEAELKSDLNRKNENTSSTSLFHKYNFVSKTDKEGNTLFFCRWEKSHYENGNSIRSGNYNEYGGYNNVPSVVIKFKEKGSFLFSFDKLKELKKCSFQKSKIVGGVLMTSWKDGLIFLYNSKGMNVSYYNAGVLSSPFFLRKDAGYSRFSVAKKDGENDNIIINCIRENRKKDVIKIKL